MFFYPCSGHISVIKASFFALVSENVTKENPNMGSLCGGWNLCS